MKVFCQLLMLSLLLSLAPIAHADLIVEPDNAFFNSHASDCTYLCRFFHANGPNGSVTVWSAPNSHKAVTEFENGATLYIEWLYGNWGCVSLPTDSDEDSGWVDMSDLTLIYDHICFQEDYAEQIQPYQNEFTDFSGNINGISFYEYPGAPDVNVYLDLVALPSLLEDLKEGYLITSIFVDENNLTWGFCGGYHINSWFCLDDPEGSHTDFPVREVTTPTFTAPSLPMTAYLPQILVGAVALITAGLLFFLYRSKQQNTTLKSYQADQKSM